MAELYDRSLNLSATNGRSVMLHPFLSCPAGPGVVSVSQRPRLNARERDHDEHSRNEKHNRNSCR